jgi:hypothetical protein
MADLLREPLGPAQATDAAGWLRSGLCTQAQLESPNFRGWIQRMGLAFKLHRKCWEYAFIAQALAERGFLQPGRRGLGFAVGREPLASLFAAHGCQIVATDLDEELARELGWVTTHQHAARLDDLNHAKLCDPVTFRRRVSFRAVDMNSIPDDLRGFDFVWSSCSFEHLGSIAQGHRFIERMTRCLKPEGVAVHNTEFNLSSNEDTIDNNPSFVLFRQRDIEAMVSSLRAQGRVVDLDLLSGVGPADAFIDEYPYRQETHLKLRIGPYVSTSVGLIIGPVGRHAPRTDSSHRPWQRLVSRLRRAFLSNGSPIT